MFGIFDYVKLAVGVLAGLFLYHLYAVSIGYPSAARAARAGYVLVAERTAAEAKAAEMERQRNAAAQATEEHRKRLEAAAAQSAKSEITREAEIRGYELLLSEKNRKCLADAADVDFLLHH
ncbi:hypothetical protein [Rhizobium leguminosarum]|uniref:hypothetical protein n=1 Tax=Rhizobium leguminosarum TaxID=384 RepID=UPI000B926E61|nr:hypothetical protein [Rhizobium leguminosarum]ASS55921.1 hypothetical protein CHR56_15865 [Rhizobium leguminosarum bv. viciae]